MGVGKKGGCRSIDCIAEENALAETWLNRRELDFMIYYEPESYVDSFSLGV